MIYADYNGSAPLTPEVKDYLIKRIQSGPFANPNAIHRLGSKTNTALEKARAVCAQALGAKSSQVIFNSGSTEGISTIFHSFLECSLKLAQNKNEEEKNSPLRQYIVISGIEHSAIVNTAQYYQKKGYSLIVLKTLPNGIVDTNDLKKVLFEHSQEIALVSIMAANNETGVIQPFQEFHQLCQEKKVPFFCDTTQLIGKAPFHFGESQLDFAIVSGHKLGALTGTGILLAREPHKLKPLIIGGGQERGLRGGTQHYLGQETLACALDLLDKKLSSLRKLGEARKKFETDLVQAFPQIKIMGEGAPRLDTTSYLSFPGIHGQAVQIELESKGIFVTTSSACSDNEPVTSKVLKSMGVCDDVGRGVVRISLGPDSRSEDYQVILEALKEIYSKLLKIGHYSAS